METIGEYLTDVEVLAEHVYRQAYYDEYMRVYEPGHIADREHLVFWSELAHRTAKTARDNVLRYQQSTVVP